MMKIKFKNNIVAGGFVLAALFLTSCVNNEDNFEDYPTSPKPLVTATTTEFTVVEGQTVNIPLDLEYAIDKPIQLQIIVTGGSATIFEDYEIGDSGISADNGNPNTGFIVLFAPYTQSLSIPFDAILDMLPEGSETVNINIAATGVRTALTKDGGINMSITIENFASDDFFVNLNWDDCDDDFDLEFYDSAFNLIGTSYSDCPEGLVWENGDLADGTYYLDVSLYTLVSEGNGPMNVTLDLGKVGTFVETVDLSSYYTYGMVDGENGNNDAYVTFTFTVVNHVFTISDPDGNTVAQGRQGASSMQQSRKDFTTW